jgi:DNA-binding YbaB/EbfC family protein
VFKGIAGLGSLLKQAHQVSAKMQNLNDELRGQRVTGSAGGGMVEIEVNGLVEVLRCRIDPRLLSDGDAELIEDLVVGAVNQAVAQAKQLHAEAIKSVTGGISLPGLDQAMGKFFGAAEDSQGDHQDAPQDGP